ncbi:hypothetical protein AJ80_03191 [Polytolypa hystricis UAMH7299]|uniref:Uncharacterized protein n=1 Tax=Polytolypa hystricis (strain UAMH7299) TaxID=1447883 RepID=A0A2B7YKI2_POLH7|nr:hypothetical protein AJ80_03191 [Polytolypa hystricis UAMH7299]
MDELELAYCIGSTYQASFTQTKCKSCRAKLTKSPGRTVSPARRTRKNSPGSMGLSRKLYASIRFPRWAHQRRAARKIEYKGYRIPEGATTVINQWAMDHDENVYGDLFMVIIILYIYMVTYPGSLLQLLLNTAWLFWAYDVRHPVGELGRTFELNLDEMMKPHNGGSAFNQVPHFDTSITVRGSLR